MLNTNEVLNSMKAPEGYQFMAIVPNYYGKGATPREALSQARKAGARTPFDAVELYLVDPKAYVNEMGNTIERPAKGKPAIHVASWKQKAPVQS